MLNRPIPSTGEAVPVIGLGTWKSFDVGESRTARAAPKAVLEEFVRLGGRLVDSSPMYGRAEQVVGDLSAELGVSERLFVATKVWTTGREQGIAEMRSSMQKMRAPRIDLMQVHNLVDVDVHLATLAEWKREGIVRYVGVTHYTANAHADVARVLARHAVDFLQINYSVTEREAERQLLPMALDRGIAVIANRPLVTGALFERERSSAAARGRRAGMHELGAAAPQVRRFTSGRDLCDSRDEQRVAPARQHVGRQRPDARREGARRDSALVILSQAKEGVAPSLRSG